MKTIKRWVLVCILLISLLPLQTVQAARGTPGSPDLGYGAWFYLNDRYSEESLALLSDLHLDWLAVEVDWALTAGNKDRDLHSPAFDQAVAAAAASGTSIMISLTNAPSWAMTKTGPDPAATTEFLLRMTKKYGGQISAIELFPGANTGLGWQANPNPSDYASLYRSVSAGLIQAGSTALLIAGGLRPLTSAAPGTDWNDLDFLRGLYAAGAQEWMPVLSVQFPQLTGSPLQTNISSNTTLRHYEAIRQVMIDFDHINGLLWITRIISPDGTITQDDKEYTGLQQQTEWLQQSLIQLRSQLYIGVVVAHNLNPASSNLSIHGQEALVLGTESIHPFYSVFKAIIHQTNPDPGLTRPGMPKSTNLQKFKNKT